MKKVYVVTGSEDGNLGVYTNKKKAFEAAFEYASDRHTYKPVIAVADKKVNGKWNNVKATYPIACRELRNHWSITLDRNDAGFANADIQTFELNN